MAMTGLKPPLPLKLEGNLTLNWRVWYGSYELYAGATGLTTKTSKVQCCAFLHVAGLEAQKLFHTMNISSSDRQKIGVVVAAFKDYCQSKSNITIVRYRFISYNQGTESIDVYIRELQYRVELCDYENMQDSILCDKLVCGVRDDKLRDKLLQTPNLKLEQCLEMCRLSEHDSRELSGGADGTSGVAEVHAVSRREGDVAPPTRPPRTQRPASTTNDWGRRQRPNRYEVTRPTCGRCGYLHARDRCPATGKQCITCGRTGHFAKVCRNGQRQAAPVNALNMDDVQDEEEWQ